MSTEERDESQPRPKKVIPSIRRENTDQEGERRPYNQGYNKPEGSYERRPYRSYGENNRPSYGDRPSRPRSYDNNREGGYGNNREGGYGNSRPSYGNNREGGYGNNRPSYGDNREGGYNSGRSSYGNNRPSYGNGGGQYNRPSRPNYDGPAKAYSASPSGEGMSADGMKKRRPRVGDTRVDYNDSRSSGGDGYAPRRSYGNDNSYGGNRQGGGGYGNNRRPSYNNNRRPGGGGGFQRSQGYNVRPKQIKYKEVLADPNEPIRLNKFLSNAGVCSRREADEFIQKGAVKVNDVVVTELGTKITRQDVVTFNEKPVQIESKVYIVLNKPKNCVTTSDDPQERLTVMDLVKNACQERIYPVGRLDRNTTGVLLLTNDGDLASKLTHPSFKKKKIYHVWLDKNVAIEDMEKIANGLELEDGEIHADAISYASEDDKSQVGIEIHSGRNRIVRRIFESLGYHVTKLDRVYFAGLTKKNLGRGKWRYLNEREVNALRMGAFE